MSQEKETLNSEQKTEILAEDLILDVAEAYPNYDQYNYTVHNLLKFRGKSITEWQQEVRIPPATEVMSLNSIEEYSRIMIGLAETVMHNLAYARSSYDTTKMHYENALNKAKMGIYNKAQEKKARIPAKEALEDIAKATIKDLYVAYKIADMFYEYWKVNYDKIKILDNRLTGLSMIKNVESRVAR